MKSTFTCPRCRGTKVWHVASPPDVDGLSVRGRRVRAGATPLEVFVCAGCGYTLWYAALPHLAATQAAIVQLLVPVLAAVAGIALLSEPTTLRLVLSGTLIAGGVLLALPRPVRS